MRCPHRAVSSAVSDRGAVGTPRPTFRVQGEGQGEVSNSPARQVISDPEELASDC